MSKRTRLLADMTLSVKRAPWRAKEELAALSSKLKPKMRHLIAAIDKEKDRQFAVVKRWRKAAQQAKGEMRACAFCGSKADPLFRGLQQ